LEAIRRTGQLAAARLRLADAKREGHVEDIENIKKEWGAELEDEGESEGNDESEEGEEESPTEDEEMDEPGPQAEEGDFGDESEEPPTERQLRIREQDALERDVQDMP
jgi:chromatin remodeling complex protein RSC6